MARLRKLTKSEWEAFRALVHQVTGIALSDQKKVLLVTRLAKRLDALGLDTFSEYFQYLTTSDPSRQELQDFINAITTNKTEFYRESHHFDLLAQWLGSACSDIRQARTRGLRIWCAASSTGEEPYTIAAVVRDAVTQFEWESVSILATDVDTRVLEKAKIGVYSMDSSLAVPPDIRNRMFLRGTATQRGYCRVRPELRERVKFAQLNLAKSGWLVRGPFDAIFCRNVLIYFDRATQINVVTRMCRLLAPHGLLFLGHSEGLAGMDLKLAAVAHSVYRPHGAIGQGRGVQACPPTAVEAHQPPDVKSAAQVTGTWTSVSLDSGMFVLFAAKNGQGVQIYTISDGPEDVAASAQVEQMLAAVRRIRKKPEVKAKILSIHDQTRAEQQSQRLDYVRQQLSQCGVEILAERTLDAAVRIRIEMSTGRMLLHRPFAKPQQSANSNTSNQPSQFAGPP